MSRRPTPTGPASCRPIRWRDVPKPGGGVRRLVLLSPADELAFARSAAAAARAICSAVGNGSHANRVVASDPSRGPILEPWRRARRRWRREVRRLETEARYVAVTDARCCYASISPDVTIHRLAALGVPDARVHEIASWLRFFRDFGIDGLPVGPVASALLADAVLSAGDEAILATGATYVRWVDDVAIFAPDARTRSGAIEALRRTWGSLGLELHDGKTAMFDDPVDGAHLLAGPASPAASSALR